MKPSAITPAFAGPLLLAALAIGLSASPAGAQGRSYPPEPYGPSPRGPNVYGPGVYTEQGRSVSVPRNCYVSREQRLIGGRLVWVPLTTCPFDESQ